MIKGDLICEQQISYVLPLTIFYVDDENFLCLKHVLYLGMDVEVKNPQDLDAETLEVRLDATGRSLCEMWTGY